MSDKIISEDIDMLSILNQSLDMVGKRDLPKEQLSVFIKETLQYEVSEFTSRKEMFNDKKNEEIEKEREVNNFPFYTDDYRTGVFIELSDDNIFLFRDKDGNEIQVMQLYKKNKDKEFVRDKEGELISTGRCLMRIKSRRGFMGFFIGLSKVEAMDEEHFYVLVGGLTTQWKVANTDDDDYHAKREDGIEYTDFPTFTLNVWQIGEITKTKSGKIKIILPECNWKEENNK